MMGGGHSSGGTAVHVPEKLHRAVVKPVSFGNCSLPQGIGRKERLTVYRQKLRQFHAQRQKRTNLLIRWQTRNPFLRPQQYLSRLKTQHGTCIRQSGGAGLYIHRYILEQHGKPFLPIIHNKS